MKKILVLIGALAVVGFGGSTAGAENRAGAFNITPVIGGYHFDGEQKLDQDVLYGIKAGYNITDRLGIESLFHYIRPEIHTGTGEDLVDVYNLRIEALYHLFPKSSFVPTIAAGYGAITNVTEGNGKAGVFSYGMGAKYFVDDDIALRLDLRHLIIDRGPTYNNFEYTFGVNFQFGGRTTTTAAVEKPAPAAEPVQAPQPVQPPAVAVKAPEITLQATPDAVEKGSSSTLGWTAQNSTTCNLQPGIGQVPLSGSRVVTPTEDTTYKLTCQGPGGEAAKGVTVRVNEPAPKDSDGDGVIDALDKCPGTPAGTRVDKDGCPLKTCRMDFPNIEFDFDKAVIKPDFRDNLGLVAAQLAKNPKSTLLLEGHTDSTGPESYNMGLSLRRAKAASKFIVDRQDIKTDRISIKGYGETSPISTNKTREGRKHNRRVEIKFTCPE
jgi:OOP family OmpA-OmpF porin